MGVLNFAHGAFITIGAYARGARAWNSRHRAVVPASLRGGLRRSRSAPLCAAVVELVLIRPLYRRHIEQVLVTVGLGLSAPALIQAIWDADAQSIAPAGLVDTTTSPAPTSRTTVPRIGAAVVSSSACSLSCAYTRLRADRPRGRREPRDGHRARIDVHKAFTLVFTIGGVAAALAGVLSGVYFGSVDPSRGRAS